MGGLERFRRQNSRRLRADMTDAERRLWQHLWRIPVEGTHFRRQAPIGPFIADFASHRLRLVIELDGAQHGMGEHRRRDFERDRWLADNGYRVLRFWNDEVKLELDAVLDTIFAVVEERRSSSPDDDPGTQPPPRGEVAP